VSEIGVFVLVEPLGFGSVFLPKKSGVLGVGLPSN